MTLSKSARSLSMALPRRYWCGVDGTENSRPALREAFCEASLRGVDLVAVHALADLDLGRAFPEGLAENTFPSAVIDEMALAEHLSEWQQRYPQVHIRRRAVRDRQVPSARSAGRFCPVGGHGQPRTGRVPSMMIGSTSQAVLHTVQTPVLMT